MNTYWAFSFGLVLGFACGLYYYEIDLQKKRLWSADEDDEHAQIVSQRQQP